MSEVKIGPTKVAVREFQGARYLETRRPVMIRRRGGIRQYGTIQTMSPLPQIPDGIGGIESDMIKAKVRDIYLAIVKSPVSALLAGLSFTVPGLGPVMASLYLGSRVTLAAAESAARAKR